MVEEMLNNILEWCFKNTNILQAKEFDGKGLIHFASKKGYTSLVATLLAKEVDVDLKDHLGETSLHLASEKGNLEMAKFLLENGADTNI